MQITSVLLKDENKLVDDLVGKLFKVYLPEKYNNKLITHFTVSVFSL